MAEKGKKKKSGARAKQVLFALVIGIACGALALALGTTDFFKRTELITLDVRYRHRPPVAFEKELGYIDFDDSSIALFGNWVWPRHRQVTLVKTLDFYDAKAAGYDVFFVEKNDIIVDPSAAAMGASPFRDIDAEFADALLAAGNIFLAEVMVTPDVSIARGGLSAILARTEELKSQMPDFKKEGMATAASFALPITDSTVESALWKAVDVTTVIPTLAAASKGLGYAQIVKDLDPTVRLYPLFMYYDGQAFPSIAVAMLSHVLDAPMSSFKISPGEFVEIKDALVAPDKRETLRIPVDDHGQMLVNWAGPFMDRGLHISFRHISSFYALSRAKEVAREYSADSSAYPVLVQAIREAIEKDQLVSEKESIQLAEEVALARIIQPMLMNGTSKEEIAGMLASLGPSPDAIKRVADVIGEALNQPSELDAGWKEEIRRNMDFFNRKERLADAEPYFFPPAVIVPWDGVSKHFSPVDLENKIFMIGLTGVGTIDINPMPFEKACPMVGLHAHALNTVMTRQFLKFPSEKTRIAATLLLAIIASLLCRWIAPLRAFLACLAVIAGYGYYVYHAWTVDGQWVHFVDPLAGVALTYTSMTVTELIRAAREKRLVRGLFSTMVSPSVLKLMERNPDRFSLTGERKEATIFFSAIDGFNRVTQGVAPDELTSILGLYLTPTSEIIIGYDGYIDKYEGHIIMADFGVPLDDPDHAWKCCYAAIEQQLDIEAFKVFVAARYGEEVSVSMGVNSGFVSAGNMGSEKKMQYTVMGDAVNVAARFRPANGIYNTGIITGEAAEPLIRKHVELRTLDKILLKGKTKPTTIYEIMGWNPEAYLETTKGKPLPRALLDRWAKCPPEKVFGYIRFWRYCESEFGNAMAGEMASFFEGQAATIEKVIVNTAVVTMDDLTRSVIQLEETLSSAGIAVEPVDTTGATWEESTSNWKKRVEAISRSIEDARARRHHLPPELPPLGDLAMQASSLIGKFEKLRQNLGKTSKLGISAVNNALQTLRNWFIGKDIPPNASTVADENRASYRFAVEKFFEKLAARPAEYHQMMAIVGSLSERRKKVRALFDQALNLHWERNWEGALAALRQARELDPSDGPVNVFIDRITGYQAAPPPPTWQGEFVQTKK